MRKRVFAGMVFVAACAGSSAKTDSAGAGARDSAVVGGRPAVPTTSAVAGDSVPPRTVAPVKKRPEAATIASGYIAPVPPLGTPASDSVRGVVAVTGTSFEKHVMVAGASGRTEITGPLANLIGHVAGAEVSVAGVLTGRQLAASSFIVRSVDNQPALDGTLREEGGVLYIVTGNGTRTRIVNPPPPLLGRNGNRVWLTGDPSKGVESFGFIDPPR